MRLLSWLKVRRIRPQEVTADGQRFVTVDVEISAAQADHIREQWKERYAGYFPISILPAMRFDRRVWLVKRYEGFETVVLGIYAKQDDAEACIAEERERFPGYYYEVEDHEVISRRGVA